VYDVMLVECQASAYQSSREKTPTLYLHCSHSTIPTLSGLLKFYYKATSFFYQVTFISELLHVLQFHIQFEVVPTEA